MTEATPTIKEAVERLIPMGLAMMQEKIKDLTCVFGLNVHGEGGGRWTVTIEQGQWKLEEGIRNYPECIYNIPVDEYLQIASGALHPMKALMAGRISISGDMNTAMKLRSLFRP